MQKMEVIWSSIARLRTMGSGIGRTALFRSIDTRLSDCNLVRHLGGGATVLSYMTWLDLLKHASMYGEVATGTDLEDWPTTAQS
jgi:hypothetical protein